MGESSTCTVQESTLIGPSGGSKSDKNKFVSLCYLGLADNQLGPATGKALRLLIKGNKRLTGLDLSGNCLGFQGGLEMAQELESIYGVVAKDKRKAIFDELTKTAFKRKKTKKIIYTSLMSLNLKRNGL